MLTVTENEKTESNILKVLGLSVGFDNTEWHNGLLMLSHKGNVVASLAGELLEAFLNTEYAKENHLDD